MASAGANETAVAFAGVHDITLAFANAVSDTTVVDLARNCV